MLLRIDGIQTGPHEADEIERRYHDGDLDRRVMSWREGEDHWISLGRRWPGRERLTFAACCIAIAVLASAGSVATARSQLEMLPLSLQTGPVLWLLVGILVCIAAATLWMAWRATSKAAKRGLAVVALSIAAMVACAWSLAVASINYSVLRIRQQASNATVTFDEAENAIRIQGHLGAHLNAQFQDVMDRHPGARMIVLDSPGGLVEDALALANKLRDERLSARIEGMCASACVAIWAASPRREMDATSLVGLHESRITANLPSQIIQKAEARSGDQYDAFLRDAGFDEATIQRGNKTPPSNMYWLNPVQVGDAGVDVVVVGRNGAPVSTAMAKWLWVEHALGKRNSDTSLMAAIRKHAPSLAYGHATPIYDALFESEPSALRQAMQSLSSDALRYALQRAADAATVRWARASYALRLHGKSEGTVCSLMTGEGSVSDAGASALIEASDDDLGELIGTIGAAGLADRLPGSPTPTIDAVFRLAEVGTRGSGYPANPSRWTGFDWCRFRFAYYGYALRLPTPQAAEVVRYFELHR